MKKLKDYLYEASLLDIEGTLNSGDEIIKKKGIEKWINDNFKVKKIKISNSANKDGKYEVSAVDVNVKNKKITSLTNDLFVWKEVENNFYCFNCFSLISLEGAPKEVGGNFDCTLCNKLTSLEGAPENVGGSFSCSSCNSLTSLKGAPKKVEWCFDCHSCESLKTLEGAPEKVDGSFDCSFCPSLITVKHLSKNINGDFTCDNCESLKSLDIPKTTKIKGEIYK